MNKTNPIFVFAALVASTLLVVIVWCFISWSERPKDTAIIQNKVVPDSLPCFLVLSDVHLHSSLLQSDIPDRAADTGHDLWDSAQQKISSILAGKSGFTKPGFIIVLGDLPWHAKADNKTNLEDAHNNSGTVLHDLRTMAQQAQVPVLYVPGNNDPWDGDYHAFSTKIFGQDTACKTCWPFIAPVAAGDSLMQGQVVDTSKLNLGCYSAYPLGAKSKLRVIALNTTLFVPRYSDEANQQAETNGQMQWLATQLEQAANQNEFVLIAMHVPPGLDGYKKKDMWKHELLVNGTPVQNAFLDLIDKYKEHIIGLLSSHTHMDGLRKLYNRDGKFIAVDISVPGISPGHGNNPGFKIISYKPGNFELQNFVTFYDKFFPAKKVTAWQDDAFDFRTTFGCGRNTTIKACLDTLNVKSLQNAVESIYKVKNGRGDAGEVDGAIDVRWE